MQPRTAKSSNSTRPRDLCSKNGLFLAVYGSVPSFYRAQKFAVVLARESLSFWDTSTYQQVGTVIKHTSFVWWTALLPNDGQIVTGEESGKVTLRDLRDILPVSYLIVNVSDRHVGAVKYNTS